MMNEFIACITFERVIITALCFIMLSMILVFIQQQSTINAMSEELAGLR